MRHFGQLFPATPVRALLACAGLLLSSTGALADRIKNPTAVFNGLDKITGRIISFEVAVDETVQFGALQITPRVCYSRPPTESPQTDSFMEVDEVTLENKYQRIFTGWMFAASPGLHAIDHAVYDVWLTECKGGTAVIAEPKDADSAPAVASRSDTPRRRERATRDQPRTNAEGQIDVAAPRGIPVQPSQAPSRRFFPTNNNAPAGAQTNGGQSGGLMPGYGGFNPAR